jgi:hypothetical protein
MDLSKDIIAAETLLREKLELYFIDLFKGISLDSHGLEHHRRVWKYARELMLNPEIVSGISDSSFPVKLIIGSYLHDSGMAVDPGPKHGMNSRQFCEIFLDDNRLKKNDFSDLLEAVENHDSKDYSSSQKKSLLFNILTVADDLDALGYIGIYRYTEIYLMRGEPLKELGNLIIKNVSGRFANLKRTFGHARSLISRFCPRLEIITGFYEKYNIRARGYNFGSGNPEGYCGIVEIIQSMLINGENLEDVINSSIESSDRVISWYFGELSRELSILS